MSVCVCECLCLFRLFNLNRRTHIFKHFLVELLHLLISLKFFDINTKINNNEKPERPFNEYNKNQYIFVNFNEPKLNFNLI